MVKRLGRAIAAVGIFFSAVVVAFRSLGDFDLPWYLATGRVIWNQRSIPHIDDLAFTHGALRYTEVLSDLLFYLAFRCGGPFGLQLVGGATVALLSLLLLWSCRAAGAAAYAAVGLSLAGIQSWLVVRATTLSLVLLAATVLAIDVHRRRPGTRGGRVALFSLVGIHFVWANTHGSVAIGLIVATWYLVYRVLARLAATKGLAWLPGADGTHVVETVVAVLLSIAVAMLNTEGPKLLLGPARADERLAKFSEWARPSWSFMTHSEPLACAFVLCALVLVVVAKDRERGGRSPLFDIGYLAMAGVFSATAIRLIPVAVILVTPGIAWRLPHITRPLPAISCAMMMLLCPLLVLNSDKIPLGVGWEPSHFPERAIEYVEQSSPRGVMWNSAPFGGYLAWRLYPKYRVFADGRNSLARDTTLVDRAFASEEDPAVFQNLVDEYHMEWALTPAFEHAEFGRAVGRSPNWTMVYLDDIAGVYVRTEGPNRSLAREGYRWLRHQTPLSAVLEAALASDGPVEALSHDGRLAAAQAPMSPAAAFVDGCGALASGDASHFEHVLARLKQLAPGHPAAAVLEQAWARKAR